MNSTIETKAFLFSNANNTQLISMPTKFTSIEVNLFKQLLQRFSEDSEANISNSTCLNPQKIAVDFKHTTFIDNDGLIGLCKIFQLAKAKKIDLTFISFSPQIKIVLSLAGLEHMFNREKNTIVPCHF